MTLHMKDKNKPEYSKVATSDAVNALPKPVEVLQPFDISVFDLQYFLAMKRLVMEVVHKNQELESANV